MFNNAYINNSTKIQRIELDDSTNPTVLFSGKALIKSIMFYSSNGVNVVFLKLYDKNTTPDENDTPILTNRLATGTNNIAYPQSSPIRRVNSDIFVQNGISIRTTADIDDNSTTPINIITGIAWVYIDYLEV